MRRIMHKTGWIITTIALFTFAGCACLLMDFSGVLNLSGEWEVIKRDIPISALDTAPKEARSIITLPGIWPALVQNNNDLAHTFWLRKKVSIPHEMATDILILNLGRIATADEAYFNGVKIGGSGKIPGNNSLGYIPAWLYTRRYFVPANLLRADGENEVAIRVFSHIITGMAGTPKIASFYRTHPLERIFDDLPTVFNIGFFLLNSILGTLLFIIFASQKRTREFIFASGLILTAAVIHLLIFGLLPFDGLVQFKIALSGFMIAYLIFTLSVEDFFSIKIKPLSVFFIIACGAIALWIFTAPDSRHLMTRCGYAVLAITVGMVLYFTLLYAVSLFRDPYRFRWALVVALPLFLNCIPIVHATLSADAYRFYRYMVFQLPLALLGAMLIFLFDFRSVQKEKKSLTQFLLKTRQQMEKLKKEVSRENIKPGPRDVIYDVIEYLDTHFTESYNRKELAHRFGLNEDYIGQLFKKTTGMSITNYIFDRRIDAAVQLVLETNSKIIDIAYHVGFENLTLFYRCFKKRTGMTPNDYRKKAESASIGNDEEL